MSASFEVIVLRDEVSLRQVSALAAEGRWGLLGETDRAHLVLASRHWQVPTGEQITHMVDHPGAAQWLRVEGPRAAELAGQLRLQLPHYPEDELLAIVLDPPEPEPVHCVRVASKLAAIRPPAMESRHLAALERLLGHPETAVRRAGIRSAYGCGWPQLQALVRRRRGVEQRLADQLEHLEQYLACAPSGP